MPTIQSYITTLTQTQHGFKHIITAGDEILKDTTLNHLSTAQQLLNEYAYQARMLGTYILGILSPQNPAALNLLKTKVANDDNWRVQEMLAKAIDHYCKTMGYEAALPELTNWLDSPLANLNRAAIEGLRIWTSRPYFKHYPEIAIKLISRHKTNPSEYVRKAVGNALRDISRKHNELIGNELKTWDLTDSKVAFVHKLLIK